jgi:hypothetical protein
MDHRRVNACTCPNKWFEERGFQAVHRYGCKLRGPRLMTMQDLLEQRAKHEKEIYKLNRNIIDHITDSKVLTDRQRRFMLLRLRDRVDSVKLTQLYSLTSREILKWELRLLQKMDQEIMKNKWSKEKAH